MRYLLLFMLLWLSGCAWWPLSSKWAIENADYADKYDRPYPQRDGRRYRRMAKQVVDARHVKGMAGFFATASATGETESAASNVALGYAHYPTSWLELHGSLGALGGADQDPERLGDLLYFGGGGGLRINTPTRVAPFAGLGTFAGVSSYDIIRVALEDEDDPFFEPDPDDRENQLRLMGAIYPEVGLHVWLTHRLRATGSASYYLTTEGRQYDFWLFGITLARFTDPHFSDDFADDVTIDWESPARAPDEVRRLP